MKIKTLFKNGDRLERGELEVRILPGLPQIHIVGLPDQSMKEIGIKLKSALKAVGLAWPTGHQIIVNLRPSYFRKKSEGSDMAIALGVMAATGLLEESFIQGLSEKVIYGELGLSGDLHAPRDFQSALRTTNPGELLTGKSTQAVREGNWLELYSLSDNQPKIQRREFAWDQFWQRPLSQGYRFTKPAAQLLALCAYRKLTVLLAGPQGSGKSTWAKALHALSEIPNLTEMAELADLFGEEVYDCKWRPLEQPHHTVTTLAMVGGGVPVQPGIVTRAHGGTLILDEFLEFSPHAIESLREPVENGRIEIARRNERERFPARFQLVATTNLCPCGKMYPGRREGCSMTLGRCRSTCQRLSGPILDRVDLLAFTHTWLKGVPDVPFEQILEDVERARQFDKEVLRPEPKLPGWVEKLSLSHRRRRSLLRISRALADLEGQVEVGDTHYADAYELCVCPMDQLGQIYA